MTLLETLFIVGGGIVIIIFTGWLSSKIQDKRDFIWFRRINRNWRP